NVIFWSITRCQAGRFLYIFQCRNTQLRRLRHFGVRPPPEVSRTEPAKSRTEGALARNLSIRPDVVPAFGELAMRTVYTTGEVARICQVAPRTVSKWFDSGRLRGYRIPGSQDRRIPRDELIKFLRAYGLPLGELEEEVGRHKVLVVGTEASLRNRIRELLPEAEGYKYEV